MAELVTPSPRYRASFLAAEVESNAEGTGRGVTDDVSFDALLAKYARFASGDVPPDRVAETTWWLVDGNEYIGRIACRHALSPFLVVRGGHIGYDVRPSRRGQGHGTRMLQLALPHIAALGIDPALITCDADNVASRKIIETCGGRLATDEVDVDAARAFAQSLSDEARAMLDVPGVRYWVATR